MSKRYLYLLISLEGFCIMSIELLINKLTEPYFGSSLMVWTITISSTMFFMALGYFFGGYLSRKKNILILIPRLLATAVLCVFVSMVIRSFIPGLVRNLDSLLFSAALVQGAMLSFPIICLASLPPLVIELYNENFKDLEFQSVGRLYAISAIFGVFGTFSVGFVLIETLGVSFSLYFVLALIISFLVYFHLKNIWTLISIASFVILGGLLLTKAEVLYPSINNTSIVHIEEGLMGELVVIDTPLENNKGFKRILNINNIPQSVIVGGDPNAVSIYKYVHIISTISTLIPNQSDVLLCGLAAGALVGEFERFGHNLDVVDIDSRMYDVATEYFYMSNDDMNFVENDARSFIAKSKKKYDLIVLDISAAENQPTYLYTIESFKAVKKILNDKGLFIINFQSDLRESIKNPGYLIYQTLLNAGFKTKVIGNDVKDRDDLVFVSSFNEPDLSLIESSKLNTCCLENVFTKRIIAGKGVYTFDRREDVYLEDDLPILEYLKKESLLNNRLNTYK